MGWYFPVLLQAIQVFDQLHHHQRFAATGGHPETHAVDEVVIGNQIALRDYKIRQDAKHLIFILVSFVHRPFISSQTGDVVVSIQTKKNTACVRC